MSRPLALRATGLAGRVLLTALLTREAIAAENKGIEPPVEVVIEGARPSLRRGARDETAASSVIDGEELNKPGQTVADALRQQPGVQMSSGGSSFDLSSAFVRGATSAQLPVYVAGVRINDDVAGTADMSTLPSWMVRRVEIYRGNAPIDADQLGIAGAIFVEPRLPRRTELVAQLGAGSYGYKSLRLLGATGNAQAGAMVAVQHEQGENDYLYVDDRGSRFDTSDDRTLRRKNADARSTSVWAIGRVSQGRTSWTMVLSSFEREQGVPGLLLTPALGFRSLQRRELGAVRGRIDCGTGCELDVATSAVVTQMRLRDPLGELALGAPELALDAARVEPSVRLKLRPTESLSLAAAIDVANERISHAPAGRARSGSTRRMARAASEVSYEPIDAWRVTLTGSAVYNATTNDTGSRTDDAPLSTRLSSRLGGDALALLVNVGRYARVPTLGELHGISPLVRGNALLRSESGLTADVGVRGSQSTQLLGLATLFEADVFGFARSVENLIAYRQATLDTVRPYNVGAASIQGLEAALAAQFARRVQLEQSLTLLDARDTTAGRSLHADLLPFRSRLVSASRVSVLLGTLGPMSRIQLGSQLFRESSRYADDAGLVVIPAQHSLDADVQASLPMGTTTSATVRLRGTNLTSVTRFDSIGSPLPPRQLFLQLELSALPD